MQTIGIGAMVKSRAREIGVRGQGRYRGEETGVEIGEGIR